MAVRISGVLKDGAGKPIQNCTIQLKARRNSTTVVVNTVASENPDEAGRYTMDVEYGQYSVSLLVEGFPPSHAGIITVYEDSKPGTLNDFLGAMTEDDARPEALRRFELMVEEVARNASAVEQNTAAAKKSASDAGTSAREAATHATDAAGSARAASTSAGQAATSAQSASSSAGTASTKATEASKSAAAAESSKSAAATSAGAAKTSETNAAASQKSAATSASTATTKASEAATSARDAAASKEAAKSSETNASSSASSAASSATAAGNSAKAAKTSETNADNSAQAAAASQTASANSATAAKKSETNAKNSEAAAKSSETNAKASETNAKSSETNAAKSAADALNYRNQAQVIVGDNIGLGSAPRDCPDISGNPSGYIGFMRIMSNAKGFPSIASGESSLTGFISQVDGTPAYTGVFQGWATRSLYTYRWNPTIGPQWTRHARKDEVDRLTQLTGNTRVYCQNASKFFSIYDSGTWGYYDAENSEWIPLSIAAGGTGAATIDGARTNLGLGRSNSPQLNSLFLDRYSDSTNTYTSSGILHTRLLATDSTVRLGADMYVETLSNEPGQLTIRFTYDGSTGASKYLNINSEGNLIVDSAILKSTVEKPLQIRSANPAIRFNETDRPANTPTYTLIANGGNWFIQKRDYDDAGSVSNAIAYNFANDRIDVQNLKASGLITANSVTTSSPVKSGGGRVEILGSVADFSAMSCYVRGLNSTGSSAAWVLGMHSGESKMVSLKNYHSNAEILLNGSDGAVQLKTGAVNGAKAQALTINKDEVNSTVDLTLTKQSGTGNRFVLQNLGNTELSFAAKVWGSSDRQNVFEVGTSAAYLFYAQKTSAGQLFDVNGAINCTTLNQSSDRDLKDDIRVISDATKAIRKMNGYTYTLKENGMPYAGVIAQEVMEAIPEAVGSFTHYGEELQGPTVDGNELREETRYLNVDYSAVTGLLVQVARETDDRVTALEEENTTLRENLATAGTRITTLENQVSELVALVRQLTGSEH
ncbi:prophage tail fiber N-terminal domain and S74 family endopeptidase-containing protein [Escherichia coli]|uniref:prophage tail fiber N-terminal domain and S74 family endopeptidase-containing protein n=1 Tax=Escherichia coli TaxID=562 RepID=UPI001E344A60|nr:prophage tail fiber N-terminal domain and S74 family endopeptidase-containing protein [Escherichia coli]MCD6989037.1 prophage tail fiber N-terminal domain and S74 family endopeptidase-containing protein [Escherichia coli]